MYLIIEYANLYMILPEETKVVEALPNPIGLKIAIVYHCELSTNTVFYRRLSVKNDAILEVLKISENGEITINGGNY